jgi:hypothetical protein
MSILIILLLIFQVPDCAAGARRFGDGDGGQVRRQHSEGIRHVVGHRNLVRGLGLPVWLCGDHAVCNGSNASHVLHLHVRLQSVADENHFLFEFPRRTEVPNSFLKNVRTHHTRLSFTLCY